MNVKWKFKDYTSRQNLLNILYLVLVLLSIDSLVCPHNNIYFQWRGETRAEAAGREKCGSASTVGIWSGSSEVGYFHPFFLLFPLNYDLTRQKKGKQKQPQKCIWLQALLLLDIFL